MNKKKDLRVIKTERNLYEALAQLLTEKTFEQIKIIDICEKSLVNRSTFYDHFSNKYELLDAMVKEKRKRFNDGSLLTVTKDNYKEVYSKFVKDLLQLVDSDKRVHKSILLNTNNSIVKETIFNHIVEDLTESIEQINYSNVPSELLAKFYFAGYTKILEVHLENPEKCSSEEVIEYANKVIQKTF